MNVVISWILAIFALIGAADYLLGNRFGLGSRFEKAFAMMGPMALSMTGIICMVPIISFALQKTIVPLFLAIGFDPGVLGGLIPIDWGGFLLGKDLAHNPLIGRYGGINVAGTFGTTMCFVIPLGMRMIKDKGQQDAFARGILEGLVVMPIGLILGGLVGGLSFGQILWHSLPVFLLSILLLFGIWKNLPLMIRIFSVFSVILKVIGVVGIAAGAFTQLTGVTLIPGLTPIADALKIVAAITVSMLGCLPFSEALARLLKKPLEGLAVQLKTSPAALSTPITTLASGTAGIAELSNFDLRGIELNAAFLTFGTSGLSAQLAFTLNNAPEVLPSYLTTKLVGGLIALCFSFWMMNRRKSEE